MPHLTVYALLFVFLVSYGCRSEKWPKDLPALRPVSLTILQEGKPLEGALVLLLPEDAGNKWTASCTTDEYGTGMLRTEGKYFGVPEGKYKVTASKVHFDYSRYVGPLPQDSVERESKQKELDEIPYDAYHSVDLLYGDATSTPLTLEVKRNGASESFDLGKAVRVKIKPTDVVPATKTNVGTETSL